MKKFLAVFMVLTVLFAFTACSSKEYVDIVVTAPVTDADGKEVTDKKGEIVTEIVTDAQGNNVTTAVEKSATKKSDIPAASGEKSSAAAADKTTEKESKTTKKADNATKKSEKTTKKSDDTTKKNAAATEKKEDNTTSTTKETTTEKPKKREVTVNIDLPYYNEIDSKLTILYKTEKDDEYQKLEFEDKDDKKNKVTYDEVKLDGSTKKYSLGKIKGVVKVKIRLTGVSIRDDSVTISAYEDSGTIKPATGVEIMEGDTF